MNDIYIVANIRVKTCPSFSNSILECCVVKFDMCDKCKTYNDKLSEINYNSLVALMNTVVR